MDSAANQARKRELIQELRKTGVKIALRYPMDHKALGYQSDRQITMHNDCMMDSGPQGTDRGTFPSDDIATWRQYVLDNISGNTYGGEPCGQSDGTGEPDGTPYDWSDTVAAVCGADGLVQYIQDYRIAYLNVSCFASSDSLAFFLRVRFYRDGDEKQLKIRFSI